MPYKVRDYKKIGELKRANPERMEAERERARARYALDKMGVDRKGKDVAHVKALASGGSNKDGVFLEPAAANRKYARNSKDKPKSPVDKGSKGKKVFKV
jgi:hypothetical protein